MKEFIALRAKAREKRDRLINQARRDYAETLARIAALEQDLLGKEVSSHKQISVCVDQVIPTDRTFTSQDVLIALEAMDPTRDWRKRSVDHRITMLRERGLVRRIRRCRNNEPAVYARIGVQVEENSFRDMTLLEVVKTMLSDRPMNDTELAVAMIEAGYDSSMSPKALRQEIAALLRESKAEFVKSDGRWMAFRP